MNIFDFIVLSLAAGALVRAWLSPNGLFDDFRDWLNVWLMPDDDEIVGAPPPRGWFRWICEKTSFGLSCAVCMSYHASFWLIVLYGISLYVVAPWSWILQVPMYVFAITRISLFIRSCELAVLSYAENVDARAA